MDLETLQEELAKILPPGFLIETSESGEIIVFTNLTEIDDLLTPMNADDLDSDFDDLDEENIDEE